LEVGINNKDGSYYGSKLYVSSVKKELVLKDFEEIRHQKYDYFRQLYDTSDDYLNNDDYCFMVNTENHICTSEGDKTYHYYLNEINLEIV